MRWTVSVIGMVILLTACERAFLGIEEQNNPVSNFEILWKDIDRYCGVLYPKNVQWDSIYDVFYHQVNLNTNPEELWSIFSEMIEALDDEHTFIYNPSKEMYYVSGSDGIEIANQSFSLSLIQNKYLNFYSRFRTAPNWGFGKLANKNIGYIYLGNMDGNHPDLTIDTILSNIVNQKAIIFDLRNNGGGVGSFHLPIAEAFSTERMRVMSMQTRSGPNHSDFDAKTWNYNRSSPDYTNPIIILTDRATASAAEHLALHFSYMDHATIMGDTTAGIFSSVGLVRFLPNGWQYRFPVQMVLNHLGLSLEGIGIYPDIISINSPKQIENGVDQVLEDAIQFLFDEFGIE